jgi:hypothetical protein
MVSIVLFNGPPWVCPEGESVKDISILYITIYYYHPSHLISLGHLATVYSGSSRLYMFIL